jgi:hypothetical protein
MKPGTARSEDEWLNSRNDPIGVCVTTKKSRISFRGGSAFLALCDGRWLTRDPVRPVLQPSWRLVLGAPFFGRAEPGKLGVQRGDGFGSALLRRIAKRGGCLWRCHQGPPGSLVACVGFAAKRSDSAQLQGRFIEKRVRVYLPEYGPVPNSGRLLVARRERIGKVVIGIGDASAGCLGGHSDGVKSSVAVGIDRVNVHGGDPLWSRSSRAHHMN